MNLDEAVDAILAAVPLHVSVNSEPLQGTDDYGTSQNAPFFVVGPPELSWEEEGYCNGGPSDATFPVVVVVDENQFTTRDSPQLAISVARAIQMELTDAIVGPVVRPVAFTGGGSGDRPAYEIPVNVKLSD